MGNSSPRTTDTQVNAGTILTIPVAANENGANLIFHLSGGSASLNVNDQTYNSEGSQVNIPFRSFRRYGSECEFCFTSLYFIY